MQWKQCNKANAPLVFHELNRMRFQEPGRITSICPEKTVLLEKKGKEREGRFDFLVQGNKKNLGIEVLQRPSQGKMREKLAYAKEVDEFVFVLPKESLGLYKKTKTNGIKRIAHKKYLSKEFSNPKLKVWLVDCANGKIAEKGPFGKVFEVRQSFNSCSEY